MKGKAFDELVTSKKRQRRKKTTTDERQFGLVVGNPLPPFTPAPELLSPFKHIHKMNLYKPITKAEQYDTRIKIIELELDEIAKQMIPLNDLVQQGSTRGVGNLINQGEQLREQLESMKRDYAARLDVAKKLNLDQLKNVYSRIAVDFFNQYNQHPTPDHPKQSVTGRVKAIESLTMDYRFPSDQLMPYHLHLVNQGLITPVIPPDVSGISPGTSLSSP